MNKRLPGDNLPRLGGPFQQGEGVKVGDKVSFRGRGSKLTGIVTKIRVHEKRGRNRELAYRVTGDASSLDQLVGIIAASDGRKWEYGLRGLTVEGKATKKQLAAARQQVEDIQDNRRRAKNQQRDLRLDTVFEDDGLRSLKIGDRIKISYRDGNGYGTYKGLSASGRVRYLPDGARKNRFTGPKFVSPAPKA